MRLSLPESFSTDFPAAPTLSEISLSSCYRDAHPHSSIETRHLHMSASRSAANSPLRCSSHRSAASPSSPDDRQLARARLFLRRKRRTPTGPSSAPSPQQIALNDPLEASRAATAASLSSDRFRHRESISSCLPFSTVTQPALVLFPNQIRIYSQQAPRNSHSRCCQD